MENSNNKKRNFKYFLFDAFWGLYVFIGLHWVSEYKSCGQIYMAREGVTLYGDAAVFTAYSVTIIGSIAFIYSLYIAIKELFKNEPNKKMKADEN